MKILFHHRTRSKDGQYVHIKELTDALTARGHQVIIVGPPAHEADDFGADGGLVAWLKRRLPRAIYECLELGYSFPAYRRLKAAYLAHRPDVLYERYNLFFPAGVWLHRKYGIPMVSEVNAPLAHERARFGGLSLGALARWSERTVWRGADRVLPVTDALADFVRAEGVPEERITVIQNGIDPSHFPGSAARADCKASFGLSDRLVMGFTGFIRPWHGLDRVIAFLAQAPRTANLHFLVVGEGPVRAELEAQARDLGVADRVTFTGLVGRDDIPRHVGAFDIALQPDVVPYASPLKLFEYMAMGCAIVAPDRSNIREVLTHEADALLFDPDDLGAFRAALERICGDAALRERLGAAAERTIARGGYTWGENARRVEEILRQISAAPGSPKTAFAALPSSRPS